MLPRGHPNKQTPAYPWSGKSWIGSRRAQYITMVTSEGTCGLASRRSNYHAWPSLRSPLCCVREATAAPQTHWAVELWPGSVSRATSERQQESMKTVSSPASADFCSHSCCSLCHAQMTGTESGRLVFIHQKKKNLQKNNKGVRDVNKERCWRLLWVDGHMAGVSCSLLSPL